MKTLGYFQALRGWQMDNGQILSMPPDAKEEDVIAEEDRLLALQVIVEGTVDVPSVTEVGPKRICCNVPVVPTFIRVPRGSAGWGLDMPQ